MGTTGTIMGVSRYLKEMNPAIRIVGLQPADGSSIPGIRRWPQEYLPRIFERERVDDVIDIAQHEAETRCASSRDAKAYSAACPRAARSPARCAWRRTRAMR
jgi:cysteine synthase